MKNTIKIFMVCLVLAVALTMVSSTAMAQMVFGMVDFPQFFQQPLNVPSQILNGILLDNFEYWDSPYNHNWVQIEPPYPVYGYGLGYATIFNTVLDLQEGSRVLDVYRPNSIFLLGPTPTYPYARHGIRYPCNNACMQLNLDPTNPEVPGYPILSFKFRAPLGIEWFDIFEFRVYYTCPINPYGNYIKIVPLQGAPCAGCGGGYQISGPDQAGVYTISIGREFMDGTWHVVWLNLYEMTNGAVTQANAIEVYGQMFRLDDVMFKMSDFHLCEPYLFKIGPRYAQFYEPYAYLFYADYRDFCGPSIMDVMLMDANGRAFTDPLYAGVQTLFTTDPDEIRDYWINEWNADPNYLDPNRPEYGTPEPGITALIGRNMILNVNAPIFANPQWRMSSSGLPDGNNPVYSPVVLGTAAGQTNQTFLWNATVNGLGAAGIEFEGVTPLPINPFDGMPTYIPVYGPNTTLAVTSIHGQPFYGPNIVSALESALYYAGFTHWPNIAVLYFTPYVFEDIILTLEVTNGRTSDFETFPISVLNYPVENYPPYIEDVDDQFFPVGQQSYYALSFIDPDNTIFSLAGPTTTGTLPATSHSPLTPRTDMSQTIWAMTLNGLPSYQYGPWMQSLINPMNGVVTFNAQFEGAYTAIVTATDPFGASAVQTFTIFSAVPGTFLNHPPIILMDWDHPQVARAGEEFILTAPTIRVIDPDGDELYFATNLGAVGYDSLGRFMYTFTTNFPGFYTAEIIAYDIRGGYGIVTVDIEVKPWWSF